ncbi:hypothetical protein HOD88_02445 [archaeon]|nr:hypothetical protein [archaeon]MBT6995026.1 hypothetical protein [Candidatus Woesearchaeota archaeon]
MFSILDERKNPTWEVLRDKEFVYYNSILNYFGEIAIIVDNSVEKDYSSVKIAFLILISIVVLAILVFLIGSYLAKKKNEARRM